MFVERNIAFSNKRTKYDWNMGDLQIRKDFRGREIDFTKPPFGQPNEKEALAKICELAEKWNKATKK